MKFRIANPSLIGVFLSITLCVASVVEAKLYDVGTPTRAIQDLDELLGDYRVGAKTAADKAFNRQLKKKALRGTFDIRSLARDAMAEHWAEISELEQNHFVDVLSRLLERKAVFAREQGSGKSSGSQYNITYHGHEFSKQDKEKAIVRSWVHIPSENLKISLDYHVAFIDTYEKQPIDPVFANLLPPAKGAAVTKQWKIVDVVVDDASLQNNYRYQFDNIIRTGGYEDLIRRMEAKLKKLIQDEQQAAQPQTTEQGST